MKWSLPCLLLAGCSCSMSFHGDDDGPSGVALDRARLIASVERLAASSGAPARAVRCPEHLSVVAGARFECEVDLGAATVVAAVELRDDRGNAHLRWKEPFLAGDRLSARASEVLRATGRELRVACGDRMLRLTRGASVTCGVDGAARDQVRITADGGGDLHVERWHPVFTFAWPWARPAHG